MSYPYIAQWLPDHLRGLLPEEARLANIELPAVNPETHCIKCEKKLIWVRMSLNCPEHGPTGMGC